MFMVGGRKAGLNKSVLCTSTEKTEVLRRNPTGNRAISVFRGQKPCTIIILSILLFFLHFLEVKDINICLKQFRLGTRENRFQSREKMWKHRKNFIISFISSVLLSVHGNFKICFDIYCC